MVKNEHFDGILKSITENSGKNENKDGKSSMQWLSESATTLADIGNGKIKKFNKFPTEIDGSFTTSNMSVSAIGRMCMYSYYPKWRNKLPYYDTFPLILIVDFTKDGWYGVNLHYVPALLRKKILDALRENLNDSSLTEQKKIQMSYSILKASSQWPAIQHCFKRYLASHVASSLLFVDPKEWDKAILLPTERFKKQSKTQVHRKFTAKTGG